MELGNLIGKGSDGLVYQLLNNGEISNRVIKFIRLSNYGISNYLENYILLNLNHKNLANALSILLDKNNLLKVVQHRADCDLRKYIFDHKIKTKEKFDIMKQITKGLSFLHSRNILHGDIKPDNILKFNKIFKLSDFGHSRIVKTFGKTKPNDLYTIIYRPPEIKLGVYCLKSDIWALGCTFYEIFYKKPYFNLLNSNHLFHHEYNNEKYLDFDNLIKMMVINNIFIRKDCEYILNFFQSKEIFEKKNLEIDNQIFSNIGIHSETHKRIFTKKIFNDLYEDLEVDKDYKSIEEILCNQKKFELF